MLSKILWLLFPRTLKELELHGNAMGYCEAIFDQIEFNHRMLEQEQPVQQTRIIQ